MTLGHGDTGTLGHWDTGTLGHWDTGTWDIFHGTFDLFEHAHKRRTGTGAGCLDESVHGRASGSFTRAAGTKLGDE